MNLRVVLLVLAVMLAVAAVLAISVYRDVAVESVIVDSRGEPASSASSSEAARRDPEADLVPESADTTDFGITDDEFDEFKATLLRSLDRQFRESIDADVKKRWDEPAADRWDNGVPR